MMRAVQVTEPNGRALVFTSVTSCVAQFRIFQNDQTHPFKTTITITDKTIVKWMEGRHLPHLGPPPGFLFRDVKSPQEFIEGAGPPPQAQNAGPEGYLAKNVIPRQEIARNARPVVMTMFDGTEKVYGTLVDCAADLKRLQNDPRHKFKTIHSVNTGRITGWIKGKHLPQYGPPEGFSFRDQIPRTTKESP